MKYTTLILISSLLGVGCSSTQPHTPPTTPKTPETTLTKPASPLPAYNEERDTRTTIPLGQDVSLVLETPFTPSNPDTPPALTAYLTHKGNVLDTHKNALSWFAYTQDEYCEEFHLTHAVSTLGGIKVAKVTLSCGAGEDERITTDLVSLLSLPTTPISSLAQLKPLWKGHGDQTTSGMQGECVTTLTAAYEIQGAQLVITRTPKAEYTAPEEGDAILKKEDCVAPKASTERAPWTP